MTGNAFIYQPTFGDNPAARKRESALQQGDWWIGGAENRPRESDPAGWQHPADADPPQGTLISPCFRIVGSNISFLIGGGCNISDIRAELIVKNQVRLFTLTIMFPLILMKQFRQICQSIRAFELRHIHEICMVYNELFTRKKNLFKKQRDLVSKSFGFYFPNIFLPYK